MTNATPPAEPDAGQRLMEVMMEITAQAHDLPWRTGRKLGRTIYAQFGPEPDDDDLLVGVMDTVALAEDAVECHNERHFFAKEAS
jgi:hypothetical protein